MLLEIYIVLQLIAIVAFVLIFKTKSPLVSATSMVTSGILMVGAWVLRISSSYVWVASIRAYAMEPVFVETPYLAGFNIMLFGLSLVYFFTDIFDIYKNESEGMGNIKIKGADQ